MKTFITITVSIGLIYASYHIVYSKGYSKGFEVAREIGVNTGFIAGMENMMNFQLMCMSGEMTPTYEVGTDIYHLATEQWGCINQTQSRVDTKDFYPYQAEGNYRSDFGQGENFSSGPFRIDNRDATTSSISNLYK